MTIPKPTPPEILGRILKQVRDEADITQLNMGHRLGFAGATVITHIETGVREVRLWEFIEFCNQTKRTPIEVLTTYLGSVEGSHIWPKEEEQPTGRKKVQNKRKSRKQK